MAKDNPKLWNQLRQQAEARWPKRVGKGTTPQANKWMSQQYNLLGGGEVASKKDVDPKKRDYKQEAKDRAERQKKQRANNLKKRGFIA